MTTSSAASSGATGTSPGAVAASRSFPALMVAIATGAVIAVQSDFNGDMSVAGAGPFLAAMISFVGTVLTVVIVLLCQGRLPEAIRIIRTRGAWWWFAIGLCGMPIVIAMAVGIPVIGVAVASVCSVAGQTVAGMILDAKGVGVTKPIHMTVRRAVAALFALIGLGVAVATGPAVEGTTFLAAVGIGVTIFACGFLLAGQQAGNGTVTGLSGNPMIAGLSSTSGGMVGLAVILGIMALFGGMDGATMPSFTSYWWLYLSGPLGAAVTVASAWTVRFLGTLALTLAIVGGQFVMALVLDLIGGIALSWSTFLAMVAIALAVILTMAPHKKTEVEDGPRGAHRAGPAPVAAEGGAAWECETSEPADTSSATAPPYAKDSEDANRPASSPVPSLDPQRPERRLDR